MERELYTAIEDFLLSVQLQDLSTFAKKDAYRNLENIRYKYREYQRLIHDLPF